MNMTLAQFNGFSLAVSRADSAAMARTALAVRVGQNADAATWRKTWASWMDGGADG